MTTIGITPCPQFPGFFRPTGGPVNHIIQRDPLFDILTKIFGRHQKTLVEAFNPLYGRLPLFGQRIFDFDTMKSAGCRLYQSYRCR